MFNNSDEKMVVVPYRPQQKLLYAALLVLLVVLAWGGGFWAGGDTAERELKALEVELAQHTVQLQHMQRQELELRQLLAKTKVAAKVDAHALTQLQREITQLSQELADKEEENTFYKGMMSPEVIEKGLGVRSIEISPSHQAGAYELKLVIQQVARQHRLLKGSVEVRVSGLLKGEEKSFSWHQISDDVAQASQKLRFKYFQTFSVGVTLPAGFEPRIVLVEAKARSGKKQLQAQSSAPWPLAEK